MSVKTSSLAMAPMGEICRMSWFLVEVDGPKKSYSIIHSVDLIEESTNLYIDRRVKFHRDHATLSGTVMAASDARGFVDDELKRRMATAKANSTRDNWFLVQYLNGVKNVVHSVVMGQSGWDDRSTQITVTEGKTQYKATVLESSGDDAELLGELEHLKTKFFDLTFEDPIEKLDNELFPWMLVQYSKGQSNVVYSVINYSETVWKKENLYRNVVAYLRDGETIYQAVIIRKSQQKSDLDQELQFIQETSVLANDDDNESLEQQSTKCQTFANGLEVHSHKKSINNLRLCRY